VKITFVLPTLSYSGGVRVIAIYAKLLIERGHHVTVVSPGKPGLTFKDSIKLLFGKTLSYLFTTVYFDEIDGLDLIILDKDRPVIEQDLPNGDVVIATWWQTANWVMGLPESKGKKIYFMQDYGGVPGQPLDKIIATWQLPFEKIITISNWLSELMYKENIPKDLVTVIHNGVDTDKFFLTSRKKNSVPKVGFLYTDAPQKGADIVFESFTNVKKLIPNVVLSMYGSKDLPAHMKSTTNVEYHQGIPDSELAKIYSGCDIWLFASSREGFGLPILEALACGTPVVATNAGAAADIIDDSVGKLMTTYGAEEMSEAIISILNLPPQKWKELSDNAFKKSKLYSWEIAAENFEDVLDSLTHEN
tara:strand:+ start:4074 stop:5156 length:1083 start_codon:yes stop_codon:yes gene_type:complete